jgi:MFS family permease
VTEPGAVEAQEPSTRDALRRVLANRNLRRIQLAYAGSLFGDWAYATAITVWAYHEGGARAVGVYAAARFIAMAVAGPMGAVVADKMSRRRFMIALDLIRAILVSLATACVALDGPAWPVYGLGVLAAIIGSPFRSAQAGLIPRLVDSPEELTASNAVAANLENVVTFAGPALGALLVGATNVSVVFGINAATFVLSMALVGSISAEHEPLEEPGRDEGGLGQQITAGLGLVARNANLRAVAVLAAVQGFIWGALTVFTVLLAVRTLSAGSAGVGYLDAVLSVGTVVGGLVVLTRVGKGRLGQDMAIGVLGWAVPLLVMAVEPSLTVVLLALAVVGLADPWVNLGLETIPQRLAPERLISRVYAAVEGALVGAMALGAAVTPLLIHLLGFRGALVAVGGASAAYALGAFPRMRRLDQRLAVPAHLELVSSVSLFAALPPGTREELARSAEEVRVPAGRPVVREGEEARRFFVIVSGEVQVTLQGKALRTESAGDFFGEIGVLRGLPRTATVTALTDVELLAFDAAEFTAAVTGTSEAHTAALAVVSRRLGV